MIFSGAALLGLGGFTAYESYQTTGTIFSGEIWGACADGLRIGVQANVNGAATAIRSIATLGLCNEPWKVWAVADEDRPFHDTSCRLVSFSYEMLFTAATLKVAQTPGRLGRCVLFWDTAQNTVQVVQGVRDISQNGLNWGNGLQVGFASAGLGCDFTALRRLFFPGSVEVLRPSRPSHLPVIIKHEHAAPHIVGTALRAEDVGQAIVKQLEQMGHFGHHWGWIQVEGKWIQYRCFILPDGTINVGTYFPVSGPLKPH